MTVPPQDLAAARHALGKDLARYRNQAGHTQKELARLAISTRSTVANAEAGRQSVARDFWATCDDILNTGGALAAAYDRMRATARAGPTPLHLAQVQRAASTDVRTPPLIPLPTPMAAAAITPGDVQEFNLHAPPGRYFPGASIDAHVHPAVDDGRILASLPQHYGTSPFLTQPGRGLVLGRTPDGHRLYAVDRLHARRRLRAAAPAARLAIPHAYHLDELTLALLWAVTNLDAALLDDDAMLEEQRHDVTTYEGLTRSAASRDLAADLSPATRMWLGSAFCAGHILRHVRSLHDAPVFWTREQRGEEAASWLLFTHKHHYLHVTAQRFPTAVRAFCIPATAVQDSSYGERILLLLAVALMESYGIRTAVTDEPEYAATPGFVHDRTGTAIVANWIRADGIWHVDVTGHRPALAEYRDAGDYATNHSVIAAPSPHARLRNLADYLNVNWPWLIHRCKQLTDYGTAGLAQPRSRHLSLAGVDRACQHLGEATDLNY